MAEAIQEKIEIHLEEKTEIEKIIAKLQSFLDPPWHISPEEKIPPELYHDTSEFAQKRLEYLKHNKLRKNWFTIVLGNIENSIIYLPMPITANIRQELEKLIDKVKLSERTAEDMVTEVEELTKYTIRRLEEKSAKINFLI